MKTSEKFRVWASFQRFCTRFAALACCLSPFCADEGAGTGPMEGVLESPRMKEWQLPLLELSTRPPQYPSKSWRHQGARLSGTTRPPATAFRLGRRGRFDTHIRLEEPCVARTIRIGGRNLPLPIPPSRLKTRWHPAVNKLPPLPARRTRPRRHPSPPRQSFTVDATRSFFL